MHYVADVAFSLACIVSGTLIMTGQHRKLISKLRRRAR